VAAGVRRDAIFFMSEEFSLVRLAVSPPYPSGVCPCWVSSCPKQAKSRADYMDKNLGQREGFSCSLSAAEKGNAVSNSPKIGGPHGSDELKPTYPEFVHLMSGTG